jgi:hypothetical protein
MPQPPFDGFEQVGFAFNKPILDLLREMGHQGYVNSDSGILSKMAEPRARLPLTFPLDNAAIAVDEKGICASPNDVPGFGKEKFMDGRPYVYVDSDGNRYRSGFGLSYATD